MGKVRIKVKHLIYILLGTVIAVFFILPNALFIYAEAVEKSSVETSKVFYKRYISMFPFGARRAEALYNLAQKIVPSEGYDSRYKIYTTGSGGGGTLITSEMVNNCITYYDEILKNYKDSEYYRKAYGGLLDTYMMGGMFDKAGKLISEGLDSQNEEIRVLSSKYRMLYLLIGRQYSEAEKIGQKYIDENKADFDIYMLMGDINFYDRNSNEALKYYEKAKDMLAWTTGMPRVSSTMGYNVDVYPYNRIEVINRINAGYYGEGSIKGRIMINGKPAPFVYVYLKDEKDGNINAIGDERMCINAVTDFDGYYEIPGLPEGSYVLGAGVPMPYLDNTLFQAPKEGYFHLDKGEVKEYNFTFVPPMKLIKPNGTVTPVDNKVELEWDKVDGAVYYMVCAVEFEKPGVMEGSSAGISVGDRIYDTRFTIDIDKANMEITGFMMDDKGMVNPQAYLGAFYPGSTVPVYIEAYDRYGSRVKSTVPIRKNFKDMTVINVPGEGLTESDRLILDRKPEDAVKSYEKDLEKNPNDTHAMRVLSKIYTIGTKRKYDPEKGDLIEGLNKERAEELSNRLYEITKDTFYLKAILRGYLTDPKDYGWALEKYGRLPEADLDATDYGRMGDMNLYIGNYKEADMCYEKVYHANKDTNYYNLTPVVLRLYNRDYDRALTFLNILDLRLYKLDREKLVEDIKKLKSFDKGTDEYKKFEEALKTVFTSRGNRDFRNQYKDIYGKVNEPLLLEVLKEIGNYYYVFEEY